MALSSTCMKKKIIVVSGLLGSALFLYFVLAGYNSASEIFQIFPFLLVTGLLFIKKDFFSPWFNFVCVYIPVSMFLILMSPEYGSPFLKIEKSVVSLFLDVLFLVVSAVVFFYKSAKSR